MGLATTIKGKKMNKIQKLWAVMSSFAVVTFVSTIAQAADGFANKALASHLSEAGWDLEEAYQRVFRTMAGIW